MSDPSQPGDATLGLPGGDAAPKRIGPFRIVRLLGEGGFGAVYEAEQEQPVRRRVALKVIKLGMDTREVIARFEAERQALALMDHPHIARVFDAGATETGRPYFVMELVQGDPITDYCTERMLPLEQRLELFEQVCAAVQHAHGKGVIHRDLKPGNVLVYEQDGQPFARVIDFGIAKAASGRLTDKSLHTQQHLMLGTPLYMSPEQAEGRLDIDARTDVYALGVILYKLITDTTPIASDSLREAAHGEIQRIIRETEAPLPSARLMQSSRIRVGEGGKRSMDPRRLAGFVRGELDWIVMKAIEKDRTRRYASASGLSDDLHSHREGRRVVAAPPGLLYLLRKRASRHRIGLAVVVLVVATVALTLVTVDRWTGTRPAIAAAGSIAPSTGKSIAVLPFENLSQDKDNAYFAEGMQDTILTKLAGIDDLKVISRTSTAKYASHPENLRAIAAELGVDNILEGSVQKSGNQVLVNVQLIDARNDRHLWAAAYQRTLDNVLGVEGEVAQRVAEALHARLSVAEQRTVATRLTHNADAYDAYLKGLALLREGPQSMSGAVATLETATRLDPGFAEAWARLSQAHAAFYSGKLDDNPEEHQRAAREAMETVQRLAPESVESLRAQGTYLYRVARDLDGARRVLERARLISRNDEPTDWALAMIDRRMDRWKESIALQEEAMALDPQDKWAMGGALYTYVYVRDIRNAQRIVDRIRALAESDDDAMGYQVVVDLQQGDLKGLRDILARGSAGRSKEANEWFPPAYFSFARDYPTGIAWITQQLARQPLPETAATYHAWLGDFQRLSGSAAAARASYEQAVAGAQKILGKAPDDEIPLAVLARAEAGLGDRNAAYAAAQRIIATSESHGDVTTRWGGQEVLARMQARFGDKDAAIASLSQLIVVSYGGLVDESPISVAMLRLDPDWDPLRSDPRFKALLARSDEPLPLR